MCKRKNVRCYDKQSWNRHSERQMVIQKGDDKTAAEANYKVDERKPFQSGQKSNTPRFRKEQDSESKEQVEEPQCRHEHGEETEN